MLIYALDRGWSGRDHLSCRGACGENFIACGEVLTWYNFGSTGRHDAITLFSHNGGGPGCGLCQDRSGLARSGRTTILVEADLSCGMTTGDVIERHSTTSHEFDYPLLTDLAQPKDFRCPPCDMTRSFLVNLACRQLINFPPVVLDALSWHIHR